MTPRTTRTNRKPRLSAALTLLLGLSLLSTGCSRWVEMNAIEAAEPHAPAVTPQHGGMRVPAVLSSFTVLQNGSTMAPTSDLEHRVLETLADTELFSRLVYPGYRDLQPTEDQVRAKLTVSLFPEPHAGAAAWKGIVIGASMFLLAPVLPLEYDYGARMTLELVQADGSSHQYSASAEGTARYHLFGATHLATDEVKAQVLESCLSRLRQELVKDRQFVQAAYFAKHQPSERSADEFGAIPASVTMSRKSGAISILRTPTP